MNKARLEARQNAMKAEITEQRNIIRRRNFLKRNHKVDPEVFILEEVKRVLRGKPFVLTIPKRQKYHFKKRPPTEKQLAKRAARNLRVRRASQKKYWRRRAKDERAAKRAKRHEDILQESAAKAERRLKREEEIRAAAALRTQEEREQEFLKPKKLVGWEKVRQAGYNDGYAQGFSDGSRVAQETMKS